MTAPHIALSTSYQSMAALGARRKYILETTDTTCVVAILAGSGTGDSTDGVYVVDKSGRAVVLTGDRPERMSAQVEDSAQAVKYKVLYGTVTGGVWCDGENTSVQVASANASYTPAVSGNYTGSPTDIAAAADELASRVKAIEVSDKTAHRVLPISLKGAILAAGTPMAAFADSASSNPGITLANSKAVGIQWNDAATQTAIWTSFVLPLDFDHTAAATLVIIASKTGNTSGDATTFTVTAFAQSVGAAHDAGSDLGGTSGAMTGNATAKTVQRVTLAMTLPDTPANISLSIKPTNGLLGTDDVIVEGLYLEYTAKLQTS